MNEPQIQSDGRTVWVHHIAGTIGRFGELGIDVHTPDTTGCLHCTHGVTNLGDWRVFKQKMSEHHYVTVGDEHMPIRFTEELQRMQRMVPR